jgi:hypothetical protein
MSGIFNNLSLNEHLLLHDLFNARVSSFSEVNPVLDKLYFESKANTSWKQYGSKEWVVYCLYKIG